MEELEIEFNSGKGIDEQIKCLMDEGLVFDERFEIPDKLFDHNRGMIDYHFQQGV